MFQRPLDIAVVFSGVCEREAGEGRMCMRVYLNGNLERGINPWIGWVTTLKINITTSKCLCLHFALVVILA